MLEERTIHGILERYGLDFSEITQFFDTSRGNDDQRFHYILDGKYVLKINTAGLLEERRLREISRLIGRYRSIGVYCPRLIPTLEGTYASGLEQEGKQYTCYVEEYAAFPVCPAGMELDRREVIAHLGSLAARYTGVDLCETRSMWSILDLAPLDIEADEKQENADLLVETLSDMGLSELAEKADACNRSLREVLRKDYQALPRCVYQGDLNASNQLQEDGHFRGLIDFNMSGTEVNINCFVNETNWFPETEQFDNRTVSEILEAMDREQNALLGVILSQYSLNPLEKRLLPYYKRITELFQYPNVCALIRWLKDDARREKAAALIRALIEKPL